MKTTKPIILASASPRRKELLQKAGFSIEVMPVKVSEIPNKNLNVSDQILDIAQRKMQAGAKSLLDQGRKNALLITADTEVIFNNAPLGKPETRQEAYEMLRKLSGIAHTVLTAVCVYDLDNGRSQTGVEKTDIYFRPLTDEQIWAYVDTGDPFDKAGGYGIQNVGDLFIEKFEGPHDNVVGLPVDLVKTLIDKL